MSSDRNEEFTKSVRERIGDAGAEAGAETSQAARGPAEARAASDPTAAGPDSDEAAARRAAIAAMLVGLGFLPADRATPDNPAVEVLAELLPPEAEVELCLTCHQFSCSGPYQFAHTTGRFPDVATMRRGGGLRYPANEALVKGPRRDLVVCTQDAVYWTQSRARSEGEDTVALYSVPFTNILGASVRHPPRGVVEVYIDEGPTMSFGVERDLADVLQAQVDQAAQSE